MAPAGDLIDFSIIETHKENIQPLASGRSAKALASTLAPSSRPSAPTPGDTRNLNDAVRDDYENELKSGQDSDDPLDIYDRYVKWTLSAYPSAQATPESQLRGLLERATKAFQSVSNYKNDPRYLKLWLHYIHFFADAPRETYAYLARHGIGEGLALFYEEFAAWLENAGRWNQADEVYKMGIEREARPVDRLVRKFGEFQKRYEARDARAEEPSSPALPTVRPALAAKVDPFALSTPRPADPQAPRPSAGIGGSSTNRGGRQKLTIFSDAEATPSGPNPFASDGAKGWESIGTIAERKKENVMEAKPWAGERLQAGKKTMGPPKMMVFKDETKSELHMTNAMPLPNHTAHQEVVNPKTGKVERVFVNLDIVYPDENDPSKEMSFEELRAKARGWLGREWSRKKRSSENSLSNHASPESDLQKAQAHQEVGDFENRRNRRKSRMAQDAPLETTIAINIDADGKVGRPKKMKIKEVGETQTIKTNLASPSGPKLKRKLSSEPTMTMHTKAATDDILDIFNQPLRNVDPMAGQDSEGDTDYDDDDYTSAGESTGTGAISGSEFGDTDQNIKTTTTSAETAPDSVSPWSDFTASKHVPKVDMDDTDGGISTGEVDGASSTNHTDFTGPSESGRVDTVEEVIAERASDEVESPRTRFVPIPPEDYEPPVRYSRDPEAIAQSRLPFMTPIAEKTETSLGALSIHAPKDDFASRTPSRNAHASGSLPPIEAEPLSSPFQEIVSETRSPRISKLKIGKPEAVREESVVDDGVLIKERQCNPVDDAIRNVILQNATPPLSSYTSFHDHRKDTFGRAPEIRKFIKSLSKKASEKTTTSVTLPPVLNFGASSRPHSYTIRRELGKGAFAPVYLAEESTADHEEEEGGSPNLVAIKCEDPPTPWEFYVMKQLHERLGASHPVSSSLLRAHSMHLFADEGYLVEQYLDQGTLLDLVNLAKSDPTSGQATLDESVAMFFTVELLRAVDAMHSAGILHGDLKADNCLVRLPSTPCADTYSTTGSNGWAGKGLTVIDFGRAIDLRAFRADVGFVADWTPGRQECMEMREMRPWTRQIDYFGVAGVVHSLLWGKYIDELVALPNHEHNENANARRYKVKEHVKRYWQAELWTRLFDILLNSALHCVAQDGSWDGVAERLRSVRAEMQTHLSEGLGSGKLKAQLAKLEARLRQL